MKFKTISMKEVEIRNWIGTGRIISLNAPDDFLVIRMCELKRVDNFLSFSSAWGNFSLAEPGRFLSTISRASVFEDAFIEPDEWIFDLINNRLKPPFRPLFSLISKNNVTESVLIETEINLTEKGETSVHYAQLSIDLLETWQSLGIFNQVPSQFSLSMPINFPVIAGHLKLSLKECLNLNPKDVLIPAIPLISVKGEGVIRIGKTELYFELEPESENSHQYILSITGKQGHNLMTDYDSETQQSGNDTLNERKDYLQVPSQTGFNDLPLELTIRCGNLSMTLGELQNLDAGSTLLVEHVTPGEALLCHGNYLLAKGELVNVNGALGLQIKSMFRAVPG